MKKSKFRYPDSYPDATNVKEIFNRRLKKQFFRVKILHRKIHVGLYTHAVYISKISSKHYA